MNGHPRIGRVAALAFVTGVAVGCAAPADSSAATASVGASSSTGEDFSYAAYSRLLSEYVDGGAMVDYRGLKENRADLDSFVAGLANLDPDLYDAWTTDDKIAFWINAYNGLTLKAIVDHYPINASALRSVVYPKNSIRQIPGVWKKLGFRVMGSEITLDRIEHEILRGRFDEPRIHMALVCAARSCPPLRREPFLGERLDAQLEDQTVSFLGHSEKFRIDLEAGRVLLSPIFDWFGGDFINAYGTDEQFTRYKPAERAVLNFIADHLEGPLRGFLETGTYDIDFLTYDWSLNESK